MAESNVKETIPAESTDKAARKFDNWDGMVKAIRLSVASAGSLGSSGEAE